MATVTVRKYSTVQYCAAWQRIEWSCVMGVKKKNISVENFRRQWTRMRIMEDEADLVVIWVEWKCDDTL